LDSQFKILHPGTITLVKSLQRIVSDICDLINDIYSWSA